MNLPSDIHFYRLLCTYLYRYWIQYHLDEVPDAASFAENDGLVLAPTFGTLYSSRFLTNQDIQLLEERYRKSFVGFSPRTPIPDGREFEMFGDTGGRQGVALLQIAQQYRSWIESRLGPKIGDRREAYNTVDHGLFTLWQSGKTRRLIFDPTTGKDRYGYVILRNSPTDFFFMKSKSCAEKGIRVLEGSYKIGEHREENRRTRSIDLLSTSKEVALMRLELAGAGYKAFPRQAAHPFPAAL